MEPAFSPGPDTTATFNVGLDRDLVQFDEFLGRALGPAYRLRVGLSPDDRIMLIPASRIRCVGQLRSLNPRALILVLAAPHVDGSTALAAFEAGVDDYVGTGIAAEIAAPVCALARRLHRSPPISSPGQRGVFESRLRLPSSDST